MPTKYTKYTKEKQKMILSFIFVFFVCFVGKKNLYYEIKNILNSVNNFGGFFWH